MGIEHRMTEGKDMVYFFYMTKAEIMKEMRTAIKEAQAALHEYEEAAEELEKVSQRQKIRKQIKK